MVYRPHPLTEQEIRTAVLAQLLGSGGHDQVLIEELGIGSARVDVAVASDRLSGYEIKSDFDTLDRLARQMHAYHEVFDALTIVTTSAYVEQVEALLPIWWGVWVAQRTEDGVMLHERRSAMSHGRQEAASLAAMLWREDAYEFVIETLGPVVRARATRGDLQAIIAEQISIDAVRGRVLRSLLSREDLQARSHRPCGQGTNCQHDVVAGGIASPRHVAA
ncbi:sce7726 family protein [Luteimonas abyssi]|uniref:sce7726 family protein n=1 Tax=Luteimonas abyssi TaxID=1247514 RepID=UPI000737B40C|nr:sce7726 family protein [Luteimonas abyssi]